MIAVIAGVTGFIAVVWLSMWFQRALVQRLYRRGEFPAASADRIVIAGESDLIDGTWQVEGEAGFWGRGTEVAIKRVP